jgi:GAF domain-containing protein
LDTILSDQGKKLDIFDLHIEIHAEVARFFSEQKGLTSSMLDVVNLLEKSFSLYHVGGYLKDESGEAVTMLAATGETGRILAEQKFRLKIARNSIVGYVALNNEPRYAPNVADDSSYYQNPMLPYTRCELCIPISYQNRVLGVLDLQADHENAFSNSDIRAFQLLGNLLGALISGRELSERLDKTVLEIDQANKSTIRKSWRNHLQATRRNYYIQLKEKKLNTGSQPDELAQSAIQTEHELQKSVTLENGSRQTIVAVPIKLRNQVIGVLGLHFNGTSIPQDLAQLLEATSTRLALALENARLLEELKMRAERERLVGDITARVRSSTAVQDILSSAAEELGRNLGVSEVVVQLRSTEE